MTPRRYNQGRRAETAEATRRRILDVTIEIYRERGVPATTLKVVAERADVSRGTILHHFGSANGLLGSVLDEVLDSLELPDPEDVAAIDNLDGRLRAFVDAMIDFQERTSHWWSVFEAEMQRPELKEREAIYWGRLGQLQAAALGPELREDPEANATLGSVIHPATVGTFLWAFEQAGLHRDGARPLLGDFAVAAVGRIADRRSRSGGSQ